MILNPSKIVLPCLIGFAIHVRPSSILQRAQETATQETAPQMEQSLLKHHSLVPLGVYIDYIKAYGWEVIGYTAVHKVRIDSILLFIIGFTEQELKHIVGHWPKMEPSEHSAP